MADNLRIDELRRRVQKDPASIAFAQLAEEYRRAGNYDAAVEVCRAGLERHPSYLSARVTLGRALIELERLDEAAAELELVLQSAPENLAAIRGLAEIHQRRGDLGEALKQYQNALGIAKHDPDLEESVSELSRQLGGSSSSGAAAPGPRIPATEPPPIPFDVPLTEGIEFDTLTSPPPAAETQLPPSPLLATSPELEAAADEFTKALEALSSLSIDLPETPLTSGSLDPAEPTASARDNAISETAAEHTIEQDHIVELDRFIENESLADTTSSVEPVPALEPDVVAAPESSPSPSGGMLNRLQSWLGAIVTDRDARSTSRP